MSENRAAPVEAPPDRVATDAEFAAIEDVVLVRDTEAFAAADWSRVERDFDAAAFVGFAGSEDLRQTWRVAYPTLESYGAEWVRQAQDMRRRGEPTDIVREVRAACQVAEVRVNEDRAIARKRFDGHALGQRLLWETYYFLRRDGERWLITGFVGYLAPQQR